MELFDLHCDTLCEGLLHGADIRSNTGHIDLERGKRFAHWIQFFAAWLPDDSDAARSYETCRQLLDVANKWDLLDDFHIIRTCDDLLHPQSGCNALLTVENGGALGEDVGIIRYLFERGVRVITLTWNGDNAWASGCYGDPSRGLTDAGRNALCEMEHFGILPDVSHSNDVTFWEVMSFVSGPVIATHSCSRSIHNHPRNLTDEQFCAIRDRGGLVGLCLFQEHLGGSDFEQIRRQLEHFMSLDGEQTVCFGADFDGMTAPPSWNGVAVMEQLRQHLSCHGWTEEQIQAVFYTNAHNFFVRHWKQTNKE